MIGKMKEISISKIRNRILIKKKWIENGDRADDEGSNPHSNGEVFSRFFFFFFEIMEEKNKIKVEIDNGINVDVKRFIIIYTNRSFDWKSKIIIILYKYLPHQ